MAIFFTILGWLTDPVYLPVYFVEARENKPDGRLSLRQLRLGDALGRGEIEVLAGLATGDQVVTEPVKAAIQLKSGQ